MVSIRKRALSIYKSYSFWNNRKSILRTHRIEVYSKNPIATDELACCSKANVFKLPAKNKKSSVLKENRIWNQASSLKRLNKHYCSLSRQHIHASITLSHICPLSFIVLSFVFLSVFEFSLVTADEPNFSDTGTELRLVSRSDNHNNRSRSYGIEASQSALTPLRKVYTNQFAVRIKGGNILEADKLAEKHGFINLGPVLPNDEYFLFESRQTRKRSTRHRRNAQTNSIAREPKVKWIEQQIAKKRVKRDYMPVNSHSSADHLQRIKGNEINDDLTIISNDDAQQQYSSNRNRNSGARNVGNYNLNDPLWSDMWYLNPTVYDRGFDHNVREAWDLGYTGKGVVVTILDDGLERTHPDIAPNYDAKASYDVNDRDEDPTPRYDYTDENRHGTRCAGEVAAIFNNSLCIVGIAYNARIGGIRMLDGDVTDAVEAASLAHNSDHIDIYSASWGPDDDGRTVDGPAKLTRRAFEKGIREGRRGLGSIFVWASGNGGKDADSCNCDGYTNSIYTLSISSATEHGNIPWYSEACSSTLATAYSSGATGEKMIITTDLHHSCTNAHTGTSASAPLAAGIVALTLEANPKLTWRDMQHIVVRTARPLNLRAGDWIINGVGKKVSHSFGFGLMDAGAMVRLASNWTTVPEQRKCVVFYPARYKTVPHGNRLQLQLYTDGCASYPRNKVGFVEHVQAIITLTAPKRGDIQIYLTSPSGTRSTLLAKRARDTSRTGFREWAFMTTHNWGEIAVGLWTLEINNDGWDDAELIRWDLVLYGTAIEISSTGGISSTSSSSSLTPRSLSSKARARYGDLWQGTSIASVIIASSNIALFSFYAEFLMGFNLKSELEISRSFLKNGGYSVCEKSSELMGSISGKIYVNVTIEISQWYIYSFGMILNEINSEMTSRNQMEVSLDKTPMAQMKTGSNIQHKHETFEMIFGHNVRITDIYDLFDGDSVRSWKYCGSVGR
ncbi:Furin-like protease [Dirofilaria immitis]